MKTYIHSTIFKYDMAQCQINRNMKRMRTIRICYVCERNVVFVVSLCINGHKRATNVPEMAFVVEASSV